MDSILLEKPRNVFQTFENVESAMKLYKGVLVGDENNGWISSYGVNMKYQVTDEAIELTVTKKPYLFPESLIKDTIFDAFSKCNV